MPISRINVCSNDSFCNKRKPATNYHQPMGGAAQKKRHLIHGDDPVSTGVVEGGISEPWPLTTIKRGT